MVASPMLFEESLPQWFAMDGGATGSDAEEFQSAYQFASTVEGWLQPEKGVLLYQLSRRWMPGEVVEIGSFCGKSTIFVAAGCKQSGTMVYAIDPHKSLNEGGKEQYNQDFTPRSRGTLEEFQHNIQQSGLAAYVKPLVCTSEEARYQLGFHTLKLLFIDGSHAYFDVLLDYYLWHEMVAPGGYLVIDDSNFDGVNLMIQRHLDRKRYTFQGAIGHGKGAMTIWYRNL